MGIAPHDLGQHPLDDDLPGRIEIHRHRVVGHERRVQRQDRQRAYQGPYLRAHDVRLLRNDAPICPEGASCLVTGGHGRSFLVTVSWRVRCRLQEWPYSGPARWCRGGPAIR